ncbi:hypothetical protein O9K51_00922 [Purpureocillium lavendulum]|uniref:Uncharacterized protein n=1 Tax=Purpureocillium lavendulum TaxID=1247861 RepID=A0AB34G5T5_9HYPO|nr:hypothetical protein O9K51_00922 [Purpureocillium lavendulum]
MCEAREVFCRHRHCRGIIGWHILRSCKASYNTLFALDDTAGSSFCQHGGAPDETSCSNSRTRWNWAAFTSGCKVPKVVSRRRCKTTTCAACIRNGMDEMPAAIEESSPGQGVDGRREQSLLARRVRTAWEQGRDLLWEVGWREHRLWPLEAELAIMELATADDSVFDLPPFVPDVDFLQSVVDSFNERDLALTMVDTQQQEDSTDDDQQGQLQDIPISMLDFSAFDVPSVFLTEEFQPSAPTFPLNQWMPKLDLPSQPAGGPCDNPAPRYGCTGEENQAGSQLPFDGPVLDQSDETWDAILGDAAQNTPEWLIECTKRQRLDDEHDQEGDKKQRRE